MSAPAAATVAGVARDAPTFSTQPSVSALHVKQQSNLLFDWRRLTPLLAAEMSEKRLNARKSKSVGPIALTRYKVGANSVQQFLLLSDDHLQIPLLVSVWNWCTTRKTTLLLPTRAARPFLCHFYRRGCRVGSIADRFRVCVETADCSYPFVWMPLALKRISFKVNSRRLVLQAQNSMLRLNFSGSATTSRVTRLRTRIWRLLTHKNGRIWLIIQKRSLVYSRRSQNASNCAVNGAD